MKPSSFGSKRQRYIQDWVSAVGTFLFLVGVYSSMDHFDSESPPPIKKENSLSVADPYWNERLSYWFRSLSWDTYTGTGDMTRDTVSVISARDADLLRVSYYKNTSLEEIESKYHDTTPRAYSRLASGIAVIEWNIDSPRAKTIYSTLHAD